MKQHLPRSLALLLSVILGLALLVPVAQAAPPSRPLPVREAPLAAGYEDYYAIRDDGALIMWGRPEHGPFDESIPFDQPVELLDDAVGAYTSGRGETLAVDRDGTLWSINSARFQGLIDGLEQDREDPLDPVKVMEDVSMAAMDQFHSVILKRDGSVWVQGFGGFGAPWLKGTGPYLTQVMDGVVWVGITAYGGFAVTAGHELWGWGMDGSDSALPRKLLDGTYQAGGVGMTQAALTLDGDLLRWDDGSAGPEVLLREVVRCGRSWAIQADGGLWVESLGYGSPASGGLSAYTKVLDRTVYAAQGEQAVLALDEDGGIWRLTDDGGKTTAVRLGGGACVMRAKAPGLQNFTAVRQYTEGLFPDVGPDHWSAASVKAAYEAGLMQGDASGAFTPMGDIKLSEAIAVAVRVRDTYYCEETDLTASGKWYQPYMDYALAHGMLAQLPADLDRPATRAEFAALLAAALPELGASPSNGSIAFTDVREGHAAYAGVMVLAKAGVMQGRGNGIFDPDAPVKRCEAAAMLSRCIRPELRLDT